MDILEVALLGPWGPLFIFLLRLVDVSLATVRMLLVVRGHRALAPFIGFFEVMFWLIAAGTAIRHLQSPLHVVGYAGGFAAGNVVGLWIESRLALGLASVQVFTSAREAQVAEALRAEGLGATVFTGEGRTGPVQLVYSVVKRRSLSRALAVVNREAPDAFVMVEQPSAIHRGWMFPARRK
ncbi:MAG TPA: DUF5698 domain-containing protein [Longimicrobiales bacterium]|nr:DUF5698 domain-containing protein [Longimicrobiales bacterium]